MKRLNTLVIGVLLLFCSVVLGHKNQDKSSFDWRNFFNNHGQLPSTPKPPPFEDHNVNYGQRDLFDVNQFANDILGLEKDFLDDHEL